MLLPTQVCLLAAVAVAAVAAHPGGHAESYANFNQKASEHGGHHDYHHHEEKHAPIPYKFEYGVKDPHTGDHKSAWEHSDGHHVKGSYSLDEADGTKRIVEYHADPHGGFNAEVKKVGHAKHPEHHHHHDHHY